MPRARVHVVAGEPEAMRVVRASNLRGWKWNGKAYCSPCWVLVPVGEKSLDDVEPVFVHDKGARDLTCEGCYSPLVNRAKS